jgi:outer membrane receptor protein involved in Fe transport
LTLAQAAPVRFAIPLQPLAAALTAFGRQSGLQVSFDPAVAAGRDFPGVSPAPSRPSARWARRARRAAAAAAPETAEQYEAGVKLDLLGGRFGVTAAVSQITRQDVAQTVGRNISDTIGEQRTRGVELEAVGELLPGWSLQASYGYQDAEITEDNNPARLGK